MEEDGGQDESPQSPTRSQLRMNDSKLVMGDHKLASRPDVCVNSKGKHEECWCPLASVMCARQSKNRDSFFAAIRQGRIDVVNFLLSEQNCANERVTDFRDWLNVRDPDGRCGIHVAVKFKKERILSTLLDHLKKELDFGDLLNLSAQDGMNAILEACKLGSLRIVIMLRTVGGIWMTVNSENQNGRDLAVAEGHTEIVEYFDHGENMGREDETLELIKHRMDGEESEGEDVEEHQKTPPKTPEDVEEIVAPAQVEEALPEIDEQELQDRCDIISMHPALESLKMDHIEKCAKSCRLAKYRRNDIIFGEEATAAERACILFVLSGEVRVLKRSNDRHDDLLEEGDTYGERALLLGEETTDIVTANRDCYVMFLSKTSWLDNIFRHNPVYAGTVGMSMAGKYFQDAVNGKTHLSLEMKQEGEFWYGKELEKKIYDYFEIPTIEEEVEFVDRRSRRVDAVPLLHDTADGLPIKISHTYEFGNDKKVNERLRCSAAKIDEEYLYQYVFACQELGTNPLSNVIFQIRHAEKILDLHGLQISSTQALAISAALLYMQQFTGFDLSNNPIFDKGCVNSDSLRCVGIVNAISMNAHIKTVSLSRTRISREAACALGRVVSYHGTLTKLDLSSNDLRDQGIEELSKGICSSLSILHLNLSNTKCTFRGATALSNMFLKNKTLEHVNLSWNNFLSKGSAALLTSMASHPKLEEVHLEWNLLGHNGGVAFGKLLQATKSIKRIDVAHCAIPESATESICAGLASNSVLENLRLQFNPLKDGVARIKDTFFANPNWKDGQPSIRLDHCEFDAVHYAASVINATVPTGHYRFDLSNQSHRTELAKLIAFATHENGENWRNESLDGKRFSWPKGHVWVMPKQGIVELDFVHMTKTEDQVMPENIFKQLIAMLNKAVSSEVRIDLVKQACVGYRFLGEDAMSLMYTLHRTAEREEALVALFSRLCGRDAIMPKILLSCFTRREVEHVQHRLGTYYVFDSYRPEGKYRFDVGKKLDVDALCHLIGIKQKIHSSVFKFARLYELTSRANYQSVDKVENYLSGDNFPESGILELEYSIPDTAEAHAEKRMVVESELAQLERAVSVTRADQLPTTLSSLGFEYGAGARAGDDDGDSEDEHTKKAFDFKAAMNRTRTEYKLVSVLHADKAGIVKCTDMAEKPFNSYWDGGKTTIVCMLEDKDQKCRVQVVTPRGVNEYTSLLIHWDSPFKTTLDIGHVEEKEEGLVATALVASARPSSGLHLNRMKKFEEKKNSPAKQKTIPKKGGKGLRPVTPETFSNVKSLDFGLALRRSQGTRMHKPWTGFARTDPDDFRIQKVTLKAMSQHKDVGGVISKKVTGSLGPSSCVNYEFDLFMLVSMHTVPRFFTFQLTPAVDMHLYISTRSLPWEKDYIWKGETSEIGDKVVVVRPTDRNYEASKYYVTIVSGADPGHYSFVIEVSPYFPSLKYVDTLQFPRFSATKAVKILRSGPAPPPKVADLTSQNSKAGKMLSSLMNFTEERKSKSCFGAAVPDKALMTITTGLANRVADTDLRPGNSASFDPDSLRSSSAASIRSRDSLRSSSDRSSPRILAATH